MAKNRLVLPASEFAGDFDVRRELISTPGGGVAIRLLDANPRRIAVAFFGQLGGNVFVEFGDPPSTIGSASGVNLIDGAWAEFPWIKWGSMIGLPWHARSAAPAAVTVWELVQSSTVQ